MVVEIDHGDRAYGPFEPRAADKRFSVRRTRAGGHSKNEQAYRENSSVALQDHVGASGRYSS